MRRIDDITRNQYPARNQETRLSLLRLELEHASREATPFRPTPRGRSGSSGYGQRAVPADAEPEATQLVARYLRQARGAAFDAVLRVSAQFGVSVPLNDVREAATAFVAYWADNAVAGYDPLAWPGEPPVQDMLWDELSDRTLRGGSSATTVADQWWNVLPGWDAERADITSPLQRALLSSAMAHGNTRARLRLVEANLGHTPVSATSAHYRELTRVLWARIPPSAEEFRALCRLVPAATDLDSDLFTGLVERATGERPRLSDLELCDDLARKRLLTPDAATASLLEYHRELKSFESHLATGRPPPDTAELVRRMPWSLLLAHSDQLTRGLLAVGDPVWATYLANHLPARIAGNYLRAWCGQSLWSLDPARIAVSFALSRGVNWADAGASDDLHFSLDAFLRDWCRKASADDTREVAGYLAPLGDKLVNSWNAHAARNRPRRIRRLRNSVGNLPFIRRDPDV